MRVLCKSDIELIDVFRGRIARNFAKRMDVVRLVRI